MQTLRAWFAGVAEDASRKVDLQHLDKLDEAGHGGHQMVRSLTFRMLVFMGIANMIGAGIFVTTGTIAHDYAGPAVPFSYLLAGIVALLPALCYAIHAARVRGNGSAVAYAYSTMGEGPAYLIGFDLILEMIIGAAAVASGWAANLTTLLRVVFNVELDPRWTESPASVDWKLLLLALVQLGAFGVIARWVKSKSGASRPLVWLSAVPAALLLVGGVYTGIQFWTALPSVNLPAACIVIVVTGILLMGVHHTARWTVALTVIKLAVLLLFIVVGGIHWDTAKLTPMLHPAWGLLGIAQGASVAFFAFVGFETLTAGAAECKDPQRDIPRAIKWVIGICTVLYMVAAAVLVASVSYTELAGKEGAAPMAKAAEILGYPGVSVAICIGSLVSLLSVLVVSQYGLARISCTLSRFGLLPSSLSTLTRRTRVPFWSTIIPGVSIAFATALLPVDELLELCNIGTLAAFSVVCGAVVVLRIREEKPSGALAYAKVIWMPILGIFGCVSMMCFLPLLSWERFFIWMMIGVGLYLWKGRHQSILKKQNNS